MSRTVRRVATQPQQKTGSVWNRRRILAGFLCLGILPGVWLQSAYLAFWLGEGPLHTAVVLLGLFLAPVIAIFLLVRHHPRAMKVSVLLWGILCWTSSLFFSVVIPDTTANVISLHGGWMFSFAGARKRAVADRLAGHVARNLPGVDAGVPFTFEQGSISVDVELHAPGKTLDVRMVLDTGASLTTISPDTAMRLGISPGPGSPLLNVMTASGEASYPLVMISSLKVGGKSVGPLAVAVCEPCAVNNKVGLLGLNFTQHFQMIIDNKTSRIRIREVDSWVDQKDEVEPFLQVMNLVGQEQGDLLNLHARMGNRAPFGMQDLVFEVTLVDASERVLNTRRINVEKLHAGENRDFSVAIAAHPDTAAFRIQLQQAFWSTP